MRSRGYIARFTDDGQTFIGGWVAQEAELAGLEWGC